MFIAGGFSWVALSFYKISNTVKLLILFLATFNPIAILQYNGLLLDGQMSNLLWSIFCLLVIITKQFDKITVLAIISISILFLNIKTAGLIYFLIILFSYGIYLFLKKVPSRSRIFWAMTSAFIFGVALIGFNPYVTNTINHQNPIYPSLNKKVFDYTENTPKNYRDKSNIEIFFSSIFFKTDLNFSEKNTIGAELKNPFIIYSEELDSLKLGGLKKGGFGPLFGASFILVIFPLLIILALNISKFKIQNLYYFNEQEEEWTLTLNPNHIYILITSIIFLSCIITSTSNTFRYIPQFWLWLVISLAYFFIYNQNRLVKILGVFASFTMVLNILVCFYFNSSIQFKMSTDTRYILEDLAFRTRTNPVEVNFGYATATRFRFNEYQVKFKENIEALTCPNKGAFNFLPENETIVCDN